MRILVHEHVGAGRLRQGFGAQGGFAGRPVPASLAREGRAMRSALVTDLMAAGHDVVTTTSGPVDAVWLIAPETGGVHARVARRMESQGIVLLGSSAAAIGRASNKGTLARLLARHEIAHPETRVARRDADAAAIAKAIGYPAVVKPLRGAGCGGVSVAATARELKGAVALARAGAGREPLLIQRYVRGVPASVSLLADGTRALPLALNRQQVRRRAGRLCYAGGGTPFDHPLAARALDAAVRACELFPGLRGFVGVDLVLTETDAVVIEINPRLTTAYLGVRAAIERNVAEMALAACGGRLPRRVEPQRRVRFAASGRVVAA